MAKTITYLLCELVLFVLLIIFFHGILDALSGLNVDLIGTVAQRSITTQQTKEEGLVKPE